MFVPERKRQFADELGFECKRRRRELNIDGIICLTTDCGLGTNASEQRSTSIEASIENKNAMHAQPMDEDFEIGSADYFHHNFWRISPEDYLESIGNVMV